MERPSGAAVLADGTGPPSRRSGTAGFYILTGLVLLASIVPKFIGLRVQSFWVDELNIVRYLSYPTIGSDLLNSIRHDSHPPLYILAMWVYGHFVGTSEIALRLSSAVAGAAAVLLICGLTVRLYGRRIGVMVTALFGLSSTALYEAQTARPYALVMLLAVLSTTVFIAMLHELRQGGLPRPRTSAMLCAINLVLGMTHYSGVFLIAGEIACFAVAWLRYRAPPRALLHFAILIAPAVPPCIWLVWSLLGMTVEPINPPIAPVRLTDIISPIRAFFGQPAIAILALLPLLAAKSWRDLWPRPRATSAPRGAWDDDPWFLGGLVVVQYLLVLAAAAVHPQWMQNKNLYACFPAGYIAFALVLARTRMLRTDFGPRLVACVAFIALIGFLVTGYPIQRVSYYTPYREQIRDAALLIRKIAGPHDMVMFGAVDMSIDFDHKSSIFEPTELYLSLLDRSAAPLKASDIRVFPPTETPADQLVALEQAVAQHDPQGVILIDLPHGGWLTSAERAFLAGASSCVVDQHMISQTVVVVMFHAEQCAAWLNRNNG